MSKAELEALDTYIERHKVDEVVQELVQVLLQAKPQNPRQWLLKRLEKELSEESEDLSESDLHKLFAVTRQITAEIMPLDTIQIIMSETLKLLNCDRVSLFILDRRSGMLMLHASNLKMPIVVSPGQGIAGSVFSSKQSVNIPDCYKDRRFDQSFDRQSGYKTTSLLAAPLLDFDGTAVGVIQAINKMSEPSGESPQETREAVPFGRSDQKMLQHMVQHMGNAVRNAEVFREAVASSERSTGLLNTIQSLSQDLGSQSMLLTITMHANKIVSAQRSTVFIVDEANGQLWSVSTDSGKEIRVPKKSGIAGLCCLEGRLINIPDAYADSRFNQEVDKMTGFKTHSILAVPIISSNKQCIGVIQMINKVSYDGRLECFDDGDNEVMELFAQFVAPKLLDSSSLMRRSTESKPSEGELALGNKVCNLPGVNLGTNFCKKNRGSKSLDSSFKLEEGEEDEG